MKISYKKWIILITGATIFLFLGLIYGWSIFRAPLSEVFPEWTTSQMSLTFTISIICFCLGSFFAGQLQKKINHRILLAAAAVIIFIGFFEVSLLNTATPDSSLIKLYIFYGIFTGCGVGIGYNAVISTVNQWFADKAGLAAGVMMMGFGLGAIILGGIVNILTGSVGLFPTFKILSVGVPMILVVGMLILSKPPTQTVAGNNVSEENDNNIPPSVMIKKASFWLFVLWCILLNSAGLLIINNAATIALAFGAPAVLGLVVSVCNGAGRIFIGGAFDRFGKKNAMLLNIGFTLAAGILLVFGDITASVAIIIVGLLFSGLGYGGAPTLTSAFILKEFGPKYFPVNFSLGVFSLIPAAIIGPMISSYLIDKSGGEYTSTFVMIIILAALAVCSWIGVNKFSDK